MTAFYNEIEPYPVEWLKNLIVEEHIAPGVVNSRSIRELKPEDLQHVTQAHFFAGIGVWSHALRSAGWPDDLEVWTGSCPCQPFSSAGLAGGFDDERHLWPTWFELIRVCRPPVILGEQVASPAGLAWLDLVRADLEGEGYAFGVADLCAAGVGAPHLRQRLYFVAVADVQRLQGLGVLLQPGQPRSTDAEVGGSGSSSVVADVLSEGSQGRVPGTRRRRGSASGSADGVADTDGGTGEQGRALELGGDPRGDAVARTGPGGGGVAGELGDSGGARGGWNAGTVPGAQDQGAGRRVEPKNLADVSRVTGSTRDVVDAAGARLQDAEDAGADRDDEGSGPRSLELERTGATRGFWAEADWIPCSDGKSRPVEPGTFPLADGAPTRVGPDGTLETQSRAGTLKAYGNAICAPLAAEFIGAVIDILIENG